MERLLGSGGKTIKNSAGYDITRALVGALGFFAIPVELQLRVETIPERRVTGIGSLDPRLLEAALGMPRGVESLLLVAKGDGQATMQISIAGREADVDAALDGLGRFDVEWEDAGGWDAGRRVSIPTLPDENREGRQVDGGSGGVRTDSDSDSWGSARLSRAGLAARDAGESHWVPIWTRSTK